MSRPKKQLNLFIDTNIFLGFYRYSKDDLNKLEQLENLIVKTDDINLIVPSNEVDEFDRNRDKVISEVIKELRNTVKIPSLFSGHPQYDAAVKSSRNLKHAIDEIKNNTLDDAKKRNLKADAIISRLFSNVVGVDETLISKAKLRSDIGNPPGKTGSIGDAINWETLLKVAPEHEDLHIIAQDRDYASEIDSSVLKSFLQKEWSSIKSSNVYLYETLNDFFKVKLKHIKLIDEYVKDDLIRQLEESASFDETRVIIEKLTKVGDFSHEQLNKIFNAAINNFQVYGAHEYSQEKVGDRLWQILEPYWLSIPEQYQEEYLQKFPDQTVEIDWV